MVNIKRDLKGGTSATIEADLYASFIPTNNPNGRWCWHNITSGGEDDLIVLDGHVVKQDQKREGITGIEAQILREYKSRGYDVPKVIGEEDSLSMQYIPGLTLLEELTFDPTLTKEKVVSRLAEMHRTVRKMDRDLPEILSDEQIDFFRGLEREKLKELGLTNEQAEKHPYSHKVAARIAQIGSPLDADAITALTKLEDLFQPYLAKHGQLFVEANGKNIIGATRIDMNGVFEGIGDSFLLDIPYHPTDTFWIQRLSRADLFVPAYTRIEDTKAALITERAVEEKKNPEELFMAFQMSRVYRNTLEMVHNYKLALERKDDAQTGNPVAQMRLFQYLSNLTAHYEMADTAMRTVLNLWPQIGIDKEDEHARETFGEMQTVAGGYFESMERLHRQMAETLGVTDPVFLGRCLNSFKFFRDNGDYGQFKSNSI